MVSNRPRKERFFALVVDVAKGTAITVGLMVVVGIGYTILNTSFLGLPPLRDLKPSDFFEPLHAWISSGSTIGRIVGIVLNVSGVAILLVVGAFWIKEHWRKR